jgi:hypothetical protein
MRQSWRPALESGVGILESFKFRMTQSGAAPPFQHHCSARAGDVERFEGGLCERSMPRRTATAINEVLPHVGRSEARVAMRESSARPASALKFQHFFAAAQIHILVRAAEHRPWSV